MIDNIEKLIFTPSYIAIFVGPAVLAALVSGIFSVLSGRRSARLENITHERSKWREQIRIIAAGIQLNDKKELMSSVQKLRLQLNSYGLPKEIKMPPVFSADEIMIDMHIWLVINEIEDAIASGSHVLEEKCRLLIDYLSLLLKYDWERAKNEVNKSILVIAGEAVRISSISGVFFIFAYSKESRIKHDAWLVAIISVIIYVLIVDGLSVIFKVKIKKYGASHNKELNAVSGIWVVLYPGIKMLSNVLYLWVYIGIWSYLFLIEQMDLLKHNELLVFFSLFFFGVVLLSIEGYRILVNDVVYIRAVRDRYIEHYKIID